MVVTKTRAQIEAMARAGRVLAEVFDELGSAVRPGVSSQELNDLAERSLRLRGAEPAFLGYRGFPAVMCASPNDVVVHGIPNDTPLSSGDILTVDLGLIFQGWHSDMARTFGVGETPGPLARLLEVTRAALTEGVGHCRPGSRLGDVGYAMQSVVEQGGFRVVREFVGHGIGRSLHEDPQIPAYGRAGRGPEIKEGWVVAIEPIATSGSGQVRVLDDHWAAVTADGGPAAHFEHTVAVTEDGPRVLTARPAAGAV